MTMPIEGRGVFKEKKSIAAERSRNTMGEWSLDLVIAVMGLEARRLGLFLSSQQTNPPHCPVP